MDSDDDLLELAGIGSEEESDYEPDNSKPSRGSKRTIDESDDDENDEGEEDDDDIGELDPEEDPYPLEGKYKDEEDKNKLMQMDEMDREAILYERIQEKEKFRERRFLALRARQNKVESKTLTTGSSAKKMKTSKLSELKKQREKKSAREARRKRGDYEEEDEDDDLIDDADEDDDLRELAGYNDEEEEDYGFYSDDYGSRESRSRSRYDSSQHKEATLKEINEKIRSSRKVLEEFLYRDEFDSCIPGTFVRVNIGLNRNTQRSEYRMALVVEVKRGGKPYKLSGKPCNTYLKVSQGNSQHVVDISCLSNSEFVPEDYDLYKKLVVSSSQQLPTVGYVEMKFNDLRNMATRILTDADINKMIAKKEELVVTQNAANTVKKLGRLREELQVALERGDPNLAKSLQKKIEDLGAMFNGSKNTSKLAALNIRNQKSNQEYIRKAEKKLVETKRKQLQNNDFNDPFSRLRTNPKVFYKSSNKQDGNEVKDEKQVIDEKEEKNKIKNSIFRREGIDALIKTIDIDIDFKL